MESYAPLLLNYCKSASYKVSKQHLGTLIFCVFRQKNKLF